MEKYYFINHIVFGKFYLHVLAAVAALVFLIFIVLLFHYKNNFQAVKEYFLTAVLAGWLLFALILVSKEIKWLAVDYTGLIHKDQLDKVGLFYEENNNDNESGL